MVLKIEGKETGWDSAEEIGKINGKVVRLSLTKRCLR